MRWVGSGAEVGAGAEDETLLHLQDPQGKDDISSALGSQVKGAHVEEEAHLKISCSLTDYRSTNNICIVY